jgi:hypothetical protein
MRRFVVVAKLVRADVLAAVGFDDDRAVGATDEFPLDLDVVTA